ncbi:hypothetical protein B0H12DRAFT_1225793 [Mycena haematopus]|nr:hypothetical protein B0H12DRAFT_1225793 [Mycena haematopus]
MDSLFFRHIFTSLRSQYGSSSSRLKLLVGTVVTLDTIASVLLSDITYLYMITTFPFLGGLLSFDPKFAGYLLLSVFTVFVVQLFYASELWKLQEKRVVSSIVGVIAILAFALGLATVVLIWNDSIVAHWSMLHIEVVIALFHTFTFLAAAFSAFAQIPPKAPTTLIGRISAIFVYLRPYCGLGAAVQFSCLVVFVARPRKIFWIPFHLVANKCGTHHFLDFASEFSDTIGVFVNGLLYMLNARRTSAHDSMKIGTAAKSAISAIAFGSGPCVNISTSMQMDQDAELPKTSYDDHDAFHDVLPRHKI